MRLLQRIASLGVMLLWVSVAQATNGLAACTQLSAPFTVLGELVLSPSLNNPPKVQLCHRVGSAARHAAQARTDRAIDELYKFINETTRSTPRHVQTGYASTLVAEATRLIGLLGDGGPVLGTVSGGVYAFESRVPVPGASVTLRFLGSEQTYVTQSDAAGLFVFRDLPLQGLFITTAQGPGGLVGDAQESIIQTQPMASVLVLVETPGLGEVLGAVSVPGATSLPTISVAAVFPDTGRSYVTSAAADGSYRLTGLRTDGTFIVIAVDNDTGASASASNFLSASVPVRTINLSLLLPAVINPELINGSFAAGLAGWTTSGPVMLVDRNLVFGNQN